MSRLARALCAAAVLACAVVPVNAARAAGVDDPGWIVQPVSSTTNLADGQRILISLRSTRPDVSINAVEIHQCRLDASYTTASDLLPDTGKCPNRVVSTSADYFVTRGASDGLTALAKTSGGANVPFVVGQGVVTWTSATKHTLTCDPTHACALVLKLSIGSSAGPSVVFQTIDLSFSDANPLAACGGFAPDVLATGGSDEISDVWVKWTCALCARTHKAAPTRVSFLGEGPSVASFSNDALDLVYTAAGYDSDVGFAPDASQRRPAVAVPVALNAAVVAAGGGQHQLVNGDPIGDKARYPDGSLSLSAAEVGALLGGGLPWISRFDHAYSNDILTRNPALRGILYAPDAGISAPSVSLASTWYLTKYLSSLAPDDFVKPGPIPAPRRGPVASLALAEPPFDQLALYTGRPTLQKATVPEQVSAVDGPLWAVTDLASARALDLTPVALQSGAGFVAPTADAMNAAVAAMTPDDQGILVPSPALASTTAAPGAVQPYPLTYVVYALVPAQPLVDSATCALRTGSQTELASWLKFVTGAGQTLLPPGMQPLPPALLAQAQSALVRVGASKLTGPCAGKQPHNGDGGGGPHEPGSGSGGGAKTPGRGGGEAPGFDGGVISNPSGTGPSIPLGTGSDVPGSSEAKTRTLRATEAAVHIPAFAGRGSAGALWAVLALIAIALMMSLAAWFTSSQLRRGRGSNVTAPGRASLASISAIAAVWVGVVAFGIALVMFALGPMLQERDQRSLIASYRTTIANAANALQGLPGANAEASAPETGAPVGIVEIGALKTQDVVVEGVGSEETSRAPGHVPGTAGLGQPGNSVLVARRHAFGAAFSHLDRLRAGDEIVVTTTQGQSVYVVREVRQVGSGDDMYAPSDDDRLTLVTSASSLPWATTSAVEVVAKLSGSPFAPTPQQARSVHATGTQGDSGSMAAAVLALLALAAAAAGSVVLYLKLRLRAAYVLSVAPLVAVTVVAGETIARLLPAWS